MGMWILPNVREDREMNAPISRDRLIHEHGKSHREIRERRQWVGEALRAREQPERMPAFKPAKSKNHLTAQAVDTYRKIVAAFVHVGGQAARIRDAEIAENRTDAFTDCEMIRGHCGRAVERIYRLMCSDAVTCDIAADRERAALRLECQRLVSRMAGER